MMMMISSIIMMSNSNQYTTCSVMEDLCLTRKQNLKVNSLLVEIFPEIFVGSILTPRKYTLLYQERKKRKLTSNAPGNESKTRLEVVTPRVSELLTKGQSHTKLVL